MKVKMNVWKEDTKVVRWGVGFEERYVVGSSLEGLSKLIFELCDGHDARTIELDVHLYGS